jgi:hypothetical protein
MDMDSVRRLLGTPDNTSASRRGTVWRYAVESPFDEHMRSAYVTFGKNQKVHGWSSGSFGRNRVESAVISTECLSLGSLRNAGTSEWRAPKP